MRNKITRITVKEAAEIMGVSQPFVRAGLRHGLLPFGTAVKMSTIWTYYISPKKFYEYVGIELPVAINNPTSDKQLA